MIGVDTAQRSFCIAFTFLSGETEEDYIWALERLKSLYEQCNTALPSVILTDRYLAVINAASTLFPSAATLLCLWHVNKAVLTRCQPAFPEAEKWREFYNYWHSIINSPTEEEYSKRLAEFQQKYIPKHLEEVGYIKAAWLIPFKEKLVRAWVDQSTYFGNTATS
jgi:transposase-like protein